MKNTRNRIRLTESQLRRVIKESVGEILAKSKKDPMSQWFKDFVNKGGKNPIRQEVKEGYDYVGDIYDTLPTLPRVEDANLRDFLMEYSEKLIRE